MPTNLNIFRHVKEFANSKRKRKGTSGSRDARQMKRREKCGKRDSELTKRSPGRGLREPSQKAAILPPVVEDRNRRSVLSEAKANYEYWRRLCHVSIDVMSEFLRE